MSNQNPVSDKASELNVQFGEANAARSGMDVSAVVLAQAKPEPALKSYPRPGRWGH